MLNFGCEELLLNGSMYRKGDIMSAQIEQIVPIEAPREHARQLHTLSPLGFGRSTSHVSRIRPLVVIVTVQDLSHVIVHAHAISCANHLAQLGIQ